MSGIGSARIFGSSPSGGDSIFDAVVAPSGGDYTLISDACDGEAAGAIIGVAPGDYTEVANIDMKSGQAVIGMGGCDDSPEVLLGDYEIITSGQNALRGLWVTSEHTGLDYSSQIIDLGGNSNCIRDISFDIQDTTPRYGINSNATQSTKMFNLTWHCNNNEHVPMHITNSDGFRIEKIRAYDVLINTAGEHGFFLSPVGRFNINDIEIFFGEDQRDESLFAVYFTGRYNSSRFRYNNQIRNLKIVCTVGGAGSAEKWGVSGLHVSIVDGIVQNYTSDHVYRAMYPGNSQYSRFESLHCYNPKEGIIGDGGSNIQSCTFTDINLHEVGPVVGGLGWAMYFEDIRDSVINSCYLWGAEGSLYLGDGGAFDEGYNIVSDLKLISTAGPTYTVIVQGNGNILDSLKGDIPGGSPAIEGIQINGNYNRIDNSIFNFFEDNGTDTVINSFHTESGPPDADKDSEHGYMIGDKYRDTDDGTIYTCTDSTEGNAVWEVLGTVGYDLETDTASPVSCSAGVQYDNDGAGGAVTYDLPSASRGTSIRFVNMENEDMILQAAVGEQIQIQNTASSAGGTATSSLRGDVLELVSMDSSIWYAIAPLGSWTLT